VEGQNMNQEYEQYKWIEAGDLYYIKIANHHGTTISYFCGHIERPNYWHAWVFKPGEDKIEYTCETYEQVKQYVEQELNIKIEK
jgi:hypothetical protein